MKTLLAMCVLGALLSGEARAQLRTVVLTGEAAPGTAAGTTYANFSALPGIDAQGRVVFSAGLDGVGVDSTNNQGLWLEGASGPALMARTGSVAPGTAAGVDFASFDSNPVVNSNGQIAFFGRLTGPGVNDDNARGVWSSATGTLSLVARSGTPAPDTSSSTNFLGFFAAPAIDGAGRVAFGATLKGPTVTVDNSLGIWSQGSGTLESVARSGDPAPGTPTDVKFRFESQPAINLSGRTTLSAFITGPGVTNANNQGVWVERPATGLTMIARSGEATPGAPSATFLEFAVANSLPTINSAGQTAFTATLTGPGVTAANNTGVWAEVPASGLQLFARAGDQVPGAAAGVQFAAIHMTPTLLNNVGRVAFEASLAGPGVDATNNAGLWTATRYGLEAVVQTGLHAPGTTAGVNFQGLSLADMNTLGQTAFAANLTGPGIDATNDLGLWATDLYSQLHLLARTGEQLEVHLGDVRTISGLNMWTAAMAAQNGIPNSFNDLGEVAFRATFTDGSSGLFVSDVVSNASIVPGDANHDGKVSGADYTAWADHFKMTNVGYANGDFNRDGIVSAADYTIWADHFTGAGASLPIPVPEPASWLLALLGAAGCWLIGRHRLKAQGRC